ncbi:hypothetical protein [Acidaminococcus sp.]|uniref:hypothetical protein n=1 Tax=Acidaminococcus sp. TaxID=1872103 RepID=UPI003D7EFE8B
MANKSGLRNLGFEKDSDVYVSYVRANGGSTKAKQEVIEEMKEIAELQCVGDYCPESFISSTNRKNLDLKIRVLAAVIDGGTPGDIPGYEKAYDDYPNDGRVY